jgi:diguanylate cyclase (GGDEF)-like protein/PAS domain S-box-containing protein
MPDIKTLMLLYLITNVINAGTIAVIWSQNRRRYAGIFFFLVAMTLQAVGPTLHLLRGIIPDLISMTLSNTIMLAGVLVILMGLERFTGKKGRQIHNYALLAVFIAVSAYFVVIQPNLTARDIAVSAMLMIYTFQCCWLLLRRVDPGMRIITRLTGIVFAVYAAFNFVRIFLLVIFPDQTNDFFKSGAVNVLAITTYIVLNLCLAISLALMVNRRLLADVKAQEEKFTTAFHSSPYAITLTKPSDGTIFEVNNGFMDITGYQSAEVIGKTTLDLHLWVNEEDRLAVINELAQGHDVQGVEYLFRNKTGEVVTGIFSASLVKVNNETSILSSIGDITDRKKVEDALRESENRYRELSIVDDLTQLYNSRHFYHQLRMEIDRVDRYGQPLTLLLLDLDDFKFFNDTYGHIEGDLVLSRLGQVIKRCLRQTDSAYRYGGEEFTILLPMTTGVDGAVTAERIRAEFKRETFSPVPGKDIHLTVSIGLAQYKAQEEMKAFVHRVDQLMYKGKKNEKNRVCSEL